MTRMNNHSHYCKEVKIYLINASNTDMYKIGYTGSSIRKRINGIRTGRPYEIRLISYFSGCKCDESLLHNFLKDFRKTGEWFEMPKYIAVLIQDVFEEAKDGKDVDFSLYSEKTLDKMKVKESVESECYWDSYDGRIKIEDMTTNHLKNAIKSVEKNVQDGCINYPTCFDNMCKELHNRGIDPDSLLGNIWNR